MTDTNIMANEAAINILKDARNALESLGVHCFLAPMSLPQGMTISLHVGGTVLAAAAANVASTYGGSAAHEKGTGEEFSQEVASALADDVLIKAAYKPR